MPREGIWAVGVGHEGRRHISIANVPHHPDDLYPITAIGAERHHLPHGPFARVHPLGHRLGDDDDARRPVHVVGGECASVDDLQPERREVGGGNEMPVISNPVLGRVPLSEDVASRGAAAEGQIGR
jgi:hypothetical protein